MMPPRPALKMGRSCASAPPSGPSTIPVRMHATRIPSSPARDASRSQATQTSARKSFPGGLDSVNVDRRARTELGETVHERARSVNARTPNLVLGPSGPSRYNRSTGELHDCAGAFACLRCGIHVAKARLDDFVAPAAQGGTQVTTDESCCPPPDITCVMLMPLAPDFA